MDITLKELAAAISAQIINGDPGIIVSGVADLRGAGKSDISFILKTKFIADAEKSGAAAIISDSVDEIKGKAVLKVKNAKAAYVKAISITMPVQKKQPSISPKASVADSAKTAPGVTVEDFAVIGENAFIGENSFIGTFVSIGGRCTIGRGTVINSNVSIYPGCIIGDNCIIHSGTVIGADGFSFIEDNGALLKVPQIGNVVIGTGVEIGANSCIDRAAFGSTRIGNNVKIDNLVHIAHNCEIGESTIIVAQAGIAGSTKIGTGCVIGGQVGIVDHVTIGDGAKIGSQAGIPGNVEAGAMLTGTPARPVMQLRKAEAYMMKLEELFKRVKALEITSKENK
jgi:UDP-3-O-[3-hydroxymyristoyl] glucosamine N-acyltransferase